MKPLNPVPFDAKSEIDTLAFGVFMFIACCILVGYGLASDRFTAIESRLATIERKIK